MQGLFSLRQYGNVFCRKIAPIDLGNTPIYIVMQSKLPNDLGGLSLMRGYTQDNLDLHLQDYIDDWQGRGACMVIHDHLLVRTSGLALHSDFIGLVLHELAHVLARKEPFQSDKPIVPEVIHTEARQVAEHVSVPRVRPREEPPWLHHEGKFLRIAFHLCHRANWLGERLHPSQVYETECFGLSNCTLYAAAIAEEAARMRHASFLEILGTKFPLEFSRLWTDDVVRWLNTQPFPQKETA